MRKFKILIILAVILASTRASGQTNIENDIISALIKNEIKTLPNDTVFNRKGGISKIKMHKDLEVILVDETEMFLFDTTYYPFCSFKNENYGLPSLDNESYLDFIEKNKTKIRIDSIQVFQGTIVYISSQEIENIFKHGGWENYHKNFGFKPLIKVSRPGLNNEKNKAFIYYSECSDGLSGAGFYLILEKINNKWVVKESMLAWIS